jgi:sulfur carrier protein
MLLVVNGESTVAPDAITVEGLLKHMELGGRRVGVEVNRVVVPRSLHGQTRLNEGDRIEIIEFVGGG